MSSNSKIFNKLTIKQIKTKASAVLKAPENVNHLFDIIKYLEHCVLNKLPAASCFLIVEQIFSKLLQQRRMVNDVSIAVALTKTIGGKLDKQQSELFRSLYHETLRLLFLSFSSHESNDGAQALVTTMKLLACEGNFPLEISITSDTTAATTFPLHRLRGVLNKLLASDKSTKHLIDRFKEYGTYLDVLYYSWKLLPSLTQKGTKISDFYIQNYLDLVTALPIPPDSVSSIQKQTIQHQPQFLCPTTATKISDYDYATMKKNLNKSWNCTTNWELNICNHKKLLIILFEYVLFHLHKPILMTDFFMDSLDVGGQVSLLALQGVFTLCQQNNLAFPNIYEKLYSMFEPEIFHMKYKARLFYLADIFLSSTHLPECLVAAFAKRLARLSLVAPPQDIVIIIYFVENLLLRHPELKRLLRPVCQSLPSNDPFIADERDPTKSMAIESSLWEIVLQQRHIMPSIDQLAADLIFYRLPNTEWDLSKYLEMNENDVFDQEILKQSKCGLNFERSMGIPKKESWFYWNL